MNSKNIFSIPIEDKYIFYSPLKRMAFIGNNAMKNALEEINNNPFGIVNNDDDTIKSLQKIGLFRPNISVATTESNDLTFSPSICVLMLTTACNMACTYCYAENKSKTNVTMDWTVAKKGIYIAYQNAVNNDKKHFSLSFHGGGEPTLPQDLILKCCKYARSLDPKCHISITSNCVWDDNYRSKLLKFVNEFSISFDGAELTQNNQRPMKNGQDSFEIALKSIYEIEKANIPYGIRMTVTKQSLSKLRSNIEFIANNTKCKSVHVESVYDQGKAADSSLCIKDPDIFIEKFLEAYDFATLHNIQLKISSVRLNSITTTFCKAITDALIVTADGQLTTCYEVYDASHPLSKDFLIGKINQKEDIYLYPKVRKQLLDRIEENKQSCTDCFCFYHCAGDCPPKSILAQIKNDDFRCKVTKGLTKAMLVDKIIKGNGFWNGNKNLNINIKETSHC